MILSSKLNRVFPLKKILTSPLTFQSGQPKKYRIIDNPKEANKLIF